MTEIELIEKTYKEVLIPKWQRNWNLYARQVLKVNLDPDQQAILQSVQNNRRTSVRSGNARGKDFVSAVAATCFITLYSPAKVICTAPTGRQVTAIMMSEIATLYNRSKRFIDLGGRVLNDMIKFPDENHFLIGFKAGDKATENWSGFHSPNIMVIVTEASGVDDITFNAIEGVLQGNSRFLIVFNPNQQTGEAYNSTRSPQYHKFRLNCMNAPNVQNKLKQIRGEISEAQYKKLHIPGQVDFDWINEKLEKPGWATQIQEAEAVGEDFEWLGKWFRPNDLCRVKILGEFPEESESTLIPLAWIEKSFDRWDELMAAGTVSTVTDPMRLGVDVSGMGRDNSVFIPRHGNIVTQIRFMPIQAKTATIHMETAGWISQYLENPDTYALIDTIGEGAGVYSRLVELKYSNAINAKVSFSAKGLRDATGVRKFANMRAYVFWMLRDALNPVFNFNLAIPRNDMLLEELTEFTYEINSRGEILIEKKEDIKERLGRSPDVADSLALTFFPETYEPTRIKGEAKSKRKYGLH